MEPGYHGFEFYFEAFSELSTSRQVGMGLGPIPFTAIAEYFRMYGISDFEDFDEFAYLIRRMDNAFLEMNAEEPKPGKNQGGEKNASANPNKNNSSQGRRRRQ